MHGKIDADLFLTIVMFTIVIMKTYVVASKRDIGSVGGGGDIAEAWFAKTRRIQEPFKIEY